MNKDKKFVIYVCMTTVSEIIEMVGSAKIQSLLGVTEFSIRAARRDGKFPANWFAVISDQCAEAQVECPRGLFNFKEAQPKGDAA